MTKYVVNDPVKTGQLIREYRNRLKLTLSELAFAVNVSLGTVQQWESGRRTISTRFIARLLSILNVSAADIGIEEHEITPAPAPEKSQSTVTIPVIGEVSTASIIAATPESGIIGVDHNAPIEDMFLALNEKGKERLFRMAEQLFMDRFRNFTAIYAALDPDGQKEINTMAEFMLAHPLYHDDPQPKKIEGVFTITPDGNETDR